MKPAPRILLLAYGNPGRLDDGLGPEFARFARRWQLPGLRVSSDLQLQVEDAVDMQGVDAVLFVDAHVDCPGPFTWHRLRPKEDGSFSTHSVSARGLLALAGEYFGAVPPAFALGIRGYDFNEYEERLSPHARANLREALRFLHPVLESTARSGRGIAPLLESIDAHVRASRGKPCLTGNP